MFDGCRTAGQQISAIVRPVMCGATDRRPNAANNTLVNPARSPEGPGQGQGYQHGPSHQHGHWTHRRPDHHEIGFTHGVPSSSETANHRKFKSPLPDRHFRASKRRQPRSPVNDPGVAGLG